MSKEMTLKKARLLAGLTQMQVAKKLNITSATITNIEKGRHIPKADTFMGMCKMYGITAEEIKL